MYPFNVRVYGILINEKNELLVTDEYDYDFPHTKFPGGGLENGEGTRECLRREFLEECDLKIQVLDHFYTTDFYQKSVFNDSQIISIYYIVKNLEDLKFECKTRKFDFSGTQNGQICFRWISLKELKPDDLTLPIDRRVAEMLTERFQ
jgi:ADP-ribose pyrophosphatase YjhB (NUDIX family)